MNYLVSAIKNNIVGEAKRWVLVQNHLRDFRNYVHLEKEVGNMDLDESWYNSIYPVFYSLLDKFRQEGLI